MFEYLKFLFNKSRSSKFIKKGKCKGCGSCCRNILLYSDKDIPVTTEEQFEKIKKWDKHFRNFEISGRSENGSLLFTCRELDDNNRCRVYFFRGMGCRMYPKIDSKFIINGGKLLDGCGYYFETDKDFKSYLKNL